MTTPDKAEVARMRAQAEELRDMQRRRPVRLVDGAVLAAANAVIVLADEVEGLHAALAAATARAEREEGRAQRLHDALAPFIAGWDEFSEHVFTNSPRHMLVRGPYTGITVQMMMDGRAALALAPDADARAGTRDAVIAATDEYVRMHEEKALMFDRAEQWERVKDAVRAYRAALDGAAAMGETDNGD